MRYKHLSFEQRCQIAAFWKVGYLQKKIAEEIGVSEGTVSREIKRNSRWNGVYSPEQADAFYKGRRSFCRRKKKFTSKIQAFVREKITLEWSPEQISGYARKHGIFEISHERLYQYILKDKKNGGNLYTHLRYGKKKYKKRYGSGRKDFAIKNRVFIDQRPSIVEQKIRIGDWEADTIIGGGRKGAIITLVDRVSKKTLIGNVLSKKALETSEEVIGLLLPVKSFVLSITSDNGTEFAYHERISEALDTEFYFAHPYHSWERGLNENTNGLIRQYLPKKSDFSKVTRSDLDRIVERLNNRPRKSLGYATPNEVFEEMRKIA